MTSDAPGQFNVGGSTLAPGSSAIVISGTTHSLASSGYAVIVNRITQTLGSQIGVTGSPITYVIDGKTYTQGLYGVEISGSTLSAESQTMVSGITYSLAASASPLIVDGIIGFLQDGAPYTDVAGAALLTVGSRTYTENLSVSGFVIGSGTFTISRTKFSVALPICRHPRLHCQASVPMLLLAPPAQAHQGMQHRRSAYSLDWLQRWRW